MIAFGLFNHGVSPNEVSIGVGGRAHPRFMLGTLRHKAMTARFGQVRYSKLFPEAARERTVRRFHHLPDARISPPSPAFVAPRPDKAGTTKVIGTRTLLELA